MGFISWLLSLIPRPGDPGPAIVPQADRPDKWAHRVDVPGLKNAFWVDDGVLMRSEQPGTDAIRALKGLGVKTIVNLRTTTGDGGVAHPIEDEDGEITDRAISDINVAGIRLVHLWFHPYFPSETQVAEFLRLVAAANNRPVLVHCRHGSDRTGTMCAAYRIVVQGWDREDAIEEMERGGYGFHYEYFQNLVAFLRTMHVERIRNATFGR